MNFLDFWRCLRTNSRKRSNSTLQNYVMRMQTVLKFLSFLFKNFIRRSTHRLIPSTSFYFPLFASPINLSLDTSSTSFFSDYSFRVRPEYCHVWAQLGSVAGALRDGARVGGHGQVLLAHAYHFLHHALPHSLCPPLKHLPERGNWFSLRHGPRLGSKS